MLYSPSFFAMAFANLCTGSSFSSFALFPLFIGEHGGNAADIGIIMGALSLSSVLSRPWTSEMIDRVGRKRSFTLGSVITSAVPLTYLLFQGSLSSFYFPLLLIRILHGVGLAISITAAFTYAADIIPMHRLSEGIGIFGISGLAGMALGPVMAEFIIGRFGFDAFFWAAGGVGALGLLVHLPLGESYPGVRGRRPKAVSFFAVLVRKRILTVALLSFLFGFGLAGANNFITPFANERSIAFISLYFISYSSGAILVRLFGGRLADRAGEGRIIPFALAVTGGGIVLLIFLNGDLLLTLSGFMTGFGHGFLYPSLNALAVREEPPEIRGKATGIFTGSIDAGLFVGSIVLGYVGEFAGFPALFLVAGLALLAGLVVFRVRLPG